jgi:hypothetical protein
MKYLCSLLVFAAILGCSPSAKPIPPIKIMESDLAPVKDTHDLETMNEYEVLFSTNYKNYSEVIFAKNAKDAVGRFAADIAGSKMYCVGGVFIPAGDVREIKVKKLSARGLVFG